MRLGVHHQQSCQEYCTGVCKVKLDALESPLQLQYPENLDPHLDPHIYLCDGHHTTRVNEIWCVRLTATVL